MAAARRGRAAALLGADVKALVADRTLLGQFLETFAFRELRRQASWQDTPTGFFHFRDKDGAETDIVMEQASGDRFVRGVVLYDGETAVPFGDHFHAVPMSRLWKTP